jgi:itaconate CoA-transferase
MDTTLEGVLVVAVEQAVAAPFCTSRLADAGARVIKVERTEGDFARSYDRLARGQSSYFVWLNRGKESIALDLKAPGDRALLARILEQADVMVQNLAPGALDRLGFGRQSLQAANPRLIQCHISGFGPDGPMRDRKAYDLLMQAETGLASVTGTPEGPARVGVSVCDIATGMYAHAAILGSLIRRGRTGVGEILDVSLFDAMADWMTVPLLQAEGTGRVPPRVGLHHVSIAPYGAYACADGSEVLIAIQNEREWRAFCVDVLGDAEIANDPRFNEPSRRVANRPALDGLILEVFRTLDQAEVVARLAAVRIAYAVVNTPLDLARHPHLRRVQIDTPAGPVLVPAPPVRGPDQGSALGPVPGTNAHGSAIRAEFTERPLSPNATRGEEQ